MQIQLEKLPSIEIGQTALAWPMTLTVTFNPLRVMVMIYLQTEVKGQWSVDSEDKVETNGGDCITSHANAVGKSLDPTHNKQQ